MKKVVSVDLNVQIQLGREAGFKPIEVRSISLFGANPLEDAFAYLGEIDEEIGPKETEARHE